MRKLAPAILFASIATVMAGTAAAAIGDATPPSTDKVTGSPTVDTNSSNPQGTSYTDKSSTSPGTNALMAPREEGTGVAMSDPDRPARPAIRNRNPKVPRHVNPNPAAGVPVDSTNGAAVGSTTGTSSGK